MCEECKQRGKTWNGDDPKCAFESGVFSKDNWNCATLNILRTIAELLYNSDHNAVLLKGCSSDFVLLKWYKTRGATELALQIIDDKLTPLTLGEAEDIIHQYRKDKR